MAEVTVVTMMEVNVVMVGGMALVTMEVGVTMEARARIKHIKMETGHVSGMGTNGGVISLLDFMVTDSWSLSHKAGNKKQMDRIKNRRWFQKPLPRTRKSLIRRLKKTIRRELHFRVNVNGAGASFMEFTVCY